MAVDPDVIAAARAHLAHLGVTVADLRRDERAPVPTVAEYLPRVIAAAGVGARRAYGTYWHRMAAAWGDRPLDTIAASDVEALQRQVTATARPRRNSRGGRHTGELVIAAGISDRCEPTNLRENGAFLRLLSRVVWEEVGNDPAVCLDADVQGDGHVYLLDGRASDPGGRVAAHDIIGSVTVANGSVVPGSFEHNPRHRLLTADGFFRLSPTLETALDSRLRSRTDYLYWPADGRPL